MNNLKPKLWILAAITLTIAAKQQPPKTAEPVAQLQGCLQSHTIQQGDTPQTIGDKYGTTYQQIMDVNKQYNNPQWKGGITPQTGDKLCLPEGTVPRETNPAETKPAGELQIPATSNGHNQPPQHVYNLAVKHFGDLGNQKIVEALMIARCESSYRETVHRGKQASTGDFGLWQINYIHDQPGGILPALGYSRYDMTNGDNNAKVARHLHDRRVSKGQHHWQDWKQSKKCHGL